MAKPAGTAVEEVVMFSRAPVSGCVAVMDNGLGEMTRYAKVERVHIYAAFNSYRATFWFRYNI